MKRFVVVIVWENCSNCEVKSFNTFEEAKQFVFSDMERIKPDFRNLDEDEVYINEDEYSLLNADVHYFIKEV